MERRYNMQAEKTATKQTWSGLMEEQKIFMSRFAFFATEEENTKN